MPLNKSQEDEINCVIDSFFENFPLSPNDFIQEVTELKHVLKTPVDENHRYYWLRELFVNSALYLHLYFRPNDIAAHFISIADVEIYILDRMSSHLIELANQAQIPLSTLESVWNRTNMIFDMIPHRHYRLTFASKPAPCDGITAPPLLADMNPIYSYSIVFIPNEEFDDTHPHGRMINIAYAQVKVDCGEGHIHEETIELADVPRLHNDREEDQFKLKIEPKAHIETERFAAKMALNYLPPFKSKHDLLESKSAKQIITYRYYFNLLKNNQLSISELVHLSSCAGEVLTDPIMVELIKKEICDFTNSKELSLPQKAIVIHPVYSALLARNMISIFDIVSLNYNRCKFLSQTPIANLIQQNKLTFVQALNIPLYLKNILTCGLYFDFFSQETDWDEFSNIKKHQYQLLLDNKISSLIKSKQIQFNQINKLTELAIFLIEHYPHLINWYEQNFFFLDELNNVNSDTFFELYLRVYTARLYAIYDSTPYTISNKQDSLPGLIEELPEIAIECGMDLPILQQRFFYQLISIIRMDILSQNNKLPLHEEILHQINRAEHTKQTDWWSVFNNLIQFAIKAYHQPPGQPDSHLIYKNPKSKHIFFNRKRQKTEISLTKHEKDFCELLFKLTEVPSETEEKTVSSNINFLSKCR